MTRIVIAYDLSVEADRAVDVVARAAWPAQIVARVVTSTTGIGEGRSSFSGRESKLRSEDSQSAVAAAHQHATTRLAAAGLSAHAEVVGGKPARAIVNEAKTFGADLIVVGARTRSSIASALLGSVSTEISESAPCPILIVRVESLERVVVAIDGSPAAAGAVDVVTSWPLFASASLRVLAVAPPPSRYVDAVLSGDGLDERHAEELADSHVVAGGLVDATVERLAGHGRRATGEVRTGDAADEIVLAANDWPADLVVLGSSGGSFMRRVILGSVARTVAHGVHSSVLIVRPRPRGHALGDAAAGRR